MTNFKYRAFISYSHADHKRGVWLHKQLEKFKTPKQLVGRETAAGAVPKRLGRVYRDEAEEGAAHDLGGRIERALASSDALVVICSPHSARSKWVNQEIVRFKQLGRENRIFPVIVDGEPHADDPAEECFPDALKFELGPDGQLSNEPADPLAVDIRKFGRDDTVLRLAAGILSVDYDDLKQRDLIRRRQGLRRAQSLFAGGLLLTLLSLAGGAGTYLQSRAVYERNSELMANVAVDLNDRGNHHLAMKYALEGILGNNRIFPGLDENSAIAQLRRSLLNNRLRLTDDTAQFAISQDKTKIATARDDSSSITLLNLVAGGPSSRIVDAEQTPSLLSLSPDGKTLAVAFPDYSIRILSIENEMWMQPLLQHDKNIEQIIFSPSGHSLVSISSDGSSILSTKRTSSLWDLETMSLLSELRDECRPIVSVDFSNKGDLLLATLLDHDVGVWDANTGDRITRIGIADSNCESLSYDMVSETYGDQYRFSLDDSAIISYDPFISDEIELWDPLTGQKIESITFEQSAEHISLSHDNKRLLAVFPGSQGMRGSAVVEVWNVETRTKLFRSPLLSDNVISSAFSEDATLLVLGAADGRLSLLDAASGELIAYQFEQNVIDELMFLENTEAFISVSRDGDAKIWRAADALQNIGHFRTAPRNIGLSWSVNPEGNLIGFGDDGENFHFQVWNIRSAFDNLFKSATDPVVFPVFSRNGDYLAAVAAQKSLFVRNMRTAETAYYELGSDTPIQTYGFDTHSTAITILHMNGIVERLDLTEDGKLSLYAPDESPSVRPISSEHGSHVAFGFFEGSGQDCRLRIDVLNTASMSVTRNGMPRLPCHVKIDNVSESGNMLSVFDFGREQLQVFDARTGAVKLTAKSRGLHGARRNGP